MDLTTRRVGGASVRRRRGLLAVAAALAAGAALPAAAAAELPAGMAYELVSPLASRGLNFSETWAWGDGDRAVLSTWTGDPRGSWIAHRTPTGWESERRELSPPDAWLFQAATFVDGSDDLSWTLVAYSLKPNPATDQLTIRRADGSWEKVGAGVTFAGRSRDGRRIVLTPHPYASSPPFPALADPTGVFLWDDGAVSTVGGDAPAVAACGAIVADGAGNGATTQNGVSPDARSIVLTSNACGPHEQHVLLRRDGATVDLSTPAAGTPDAPASYVGDSGDGSVVFLRTAAALVPSDLNGVADVYRYEVAAGALTRVTAAATDAGAAVATAISSEDGARLWFSARAETATDEYDDALWVWSAGAGARTVSAVRRTAPDPSEPDPFRLVRPARFSDSTQVTLDGAAIAWREDARLGPNASQELFRATADGAVACITCVAGASTSGQPSFGSTTDLFNRALRRISDDGRAVFFETSAALDPRDWNNAIDVYGWRDGVVHLISSGEGGSDAALAGVSARGDVFFATRASLLPWIDDPHRKLYTARIGGGLPAPADATAACFDDRCQGDPLLPAAAPEPASAAYRGPGDVEQQEPPTASLRLAKVTAAGTRRLARGGALTVSARATTAGKVTATLRVRVGRRWLRAGSASRTLTRGGSVRLALWLSPAARRQLARRRSLRARVDLSQRGGAEPRSTAFTLKHATAPRRRAHG